MLNQMKYFDYKNNRLLFFNQEATPQYWDKHWEDDNFKKIVRNGKRNKIILTETKKYLGQPKGQKILEGGCGRGQFVYALNELGYDVYGVDYAKNTVEKTNDLFPELKVSFGDVKSLDFPNDFLDAYWSLGVIEHFFDGYDEIISEMARVLKKNGFLFITFPYLSPLRKLKAKLKIYPDFENSNCDIEKFYQFALDAKQVETRLKNFGFQLIAKKNRSGVKGLKDEIKFLSPALQKIYNSDNLFLKVLGFSISKIFSPFAGHSILLIFNKIK